MMSKPTTLAPPSMIAVSTRPISGVHVLLGLPSNGGVLKVSSSIATTTAGEDAGTMRIAEGLPAQHRQGVDRVAPQPIERGRRGDETGGDCNQDTRCCCAQANGIHGRGPGGAIGNVPDG